MRLLRLVPLLALPFLFLGATCVTSVEQKGPAGPWLGEVVNAGQDPANYAGVTALIFDANGVLLGGFGTGVCPETLLPGEKGAFEFRYQVDLDSVALPLRAEFRPTRVVSGFTWVGAREGLSARLVEKDSQRHYVIAEITNSSPYTYQDLSICAKLLSPDGKLEAVASSSAFPSVLAPNETRRVAIFFDPMPEGSVQFFPSGSVEESNTVVLEPSVFHVVTTKVIEGQQGREVEVLGELHNASGQDLHFVILQAYVEGEPAFPVLVSVGTGGIVARGADIPVEFSIPLHSDRSGPIVIGGIEANGGTDIYPVPVSDIAWNVTTGGVEISATLSNPTGAWLAVPSALVALRDSQGRLVGVGHVPVRSILAPGSTLAISGSVTPLGGVESVDVIAYADIRPGPGP